ncbi:MAG TPA: type II secretion system F family protein [Streptomyces sp.]|nr:type II secretion system F family protein [Streptomyces sp.]
MSADVVHRLGVVVGTALAVAWVVRRLVVLRHRKRLRQRLVMLPVLGTSRTGRRFPARDAVRHALPLVGVACAGWLLVDGVAGAAVGAVAAGGLWRWRMREEAAGAAAKARETAEAARQLPLAADLLAACIAAGAGPVIAAQAVGEALGGPVGHGLVRGAAEVRLGGEPGEAWRSLASLPGAAPLARLLERAGVSGLPAAVPVARVAAGARAEWARAATARARRAAVMVTAPVGLCFLPAFVTVGIVPVVVGLADGVLGGGGGGGG